MTTRLPASMADMEVRLPGEFEWIYVGWRETGNLSPIWEWCADPYVPISTRFITASPRAIEQVGSPERLIQGNSPNSYELRSSLPPEFSSPFVTFRLVIAPKE